MSFTYVGVRVIKFTHKGKKCYVAQLRIGPTIVSIPVNALKDLLEKASKATEEGYEEYDFEQGVEPIEQAMPESDILRKPSFGVKPIEQDESGAGVAYIG